jgi:hypothetical protein
VTAGLAHADPGVERHAEAGVMLRGEVARAWHAEEASSQFRLRVLRRGVELFVGPYEPVESLRRF